MRVEMTLVVFVVLAFVAVGCGGDNLELCDGCGPTRTPTPTASSTPTGTTPTATPGTPTATATP